MKDKRLRVLVLYRVLQHWRVPVFERLAENPFFNIIVVHGADFKGTKVVNYKGSHSFQSKELLTVPIRLGTSNGDALAPFCPGLFWTLFRFSPDVILCEGASNLPNNIIAYIYSFLFRRSTIQWGLGEIYGRRKSALRRSLDWVIEWMERSSTACLAYSTSGRHYYERIGVDPQRVFVAVNTVDTQRIAERIQILDKDLLHAEAHRESDFNILFVGALTKPKHVDRLLHAYAIVCKKTSLRVTLTIVGDGPERSALEDLAKELRCPQVRFAGQVVDGVSKYFFESDVFVLPGLGGLAVSESLAHGLPVIAGIGDGCEQDYLEEGCGIHDKELDTSRLVEHLLYLINNPKTLHRMSVAATHAVGQKFGIQSYMNQLNACIEYAGRARRHD